MQGYWEESLPPWRVNFAQAALCKEQVVLEGYLGSVGVEGGAGRKAKGHREAEDGDWLVHERRVDRYLL